MSELSRPVTPTRLPIPLTRLAGFLRGWRSFLGVALGRLLSGRCSGLCARSRLFLKRGFRLHRLSRFNGCRGQRCVDRDRRRLRHRGRRLRILGLRRPVPNRAHFADCPPVRFAVIGFHFNVHRQFDNGHFRFNVSVTCSAPVYAYEIGAKCIDGKCIE